jgi:hypothetical protein
MAVCVMAMALAVYGTGSAVSVDLPQVGLARLPGSLVYASPRLGLTVSKTVDGATLTLTIPRRSYPRDALVRVKVVLRNVSHRPMMVGTTAATECAQPGPGVEVLDAAGSGLYPPTVPWVMASCGPVPRPIRLLPGHTLHHAILTILRGPLVRGVATLFPGYAVEEVVTPSLQVTLTNGPAPTLTLITAPSLRLVVTPPSSIAHHTFYFVQGSVCPASPPAVQYRSAAPRWEPTGTPKNGQFHLIEPCASPVRWVVAGGWLNQPVVTLDYPPR